MPRTVRCSAQSAKGRLRKAEQFYEAATLIVDLTEDHREAQDLLGRVDNRLARELGTLLGLKTKAGYDHRPVSADDRRRAARAAGRLVEAARVA